MASHASSPSPAFDYSVDTAGSNITDDVEQLSRLASTRQTRRLQLRNAGFRGPTVPTRLVTPKSSSVSSTWSTIGDPESLSGTENVPPPGFDICTPWSTQRLSSGPLKDIGNGTLTQPKQRSQRPSSRRVSDSEGSLDDTPYGKRVVSKTNQNLTIRQRSAKTKTKVTHRRRTVSAEASKYIEHLEAELASTQSQLSKINSPTIVRQQSSRIRTADAERELLQKEIDDWESKYEHRLQDVVDQHYDIELGLRNQIRTLEQDVDESRFHMAELQAQLATTARNMEAAEVANVNLERRIEIMSELLATSPSKIDLHAEVPGRGRKHVHPKSMLPRFPTASSLLGSPERGPQTQPPSPLLSFANYSPHVPSSPAYSVCRYDSTAQQSDYMSEAESVFSELSATGDSMTSAGTFDQHSSFNPWSLPPPPPARSKPARRMRRFGAGSMGPKPLILPSTAQCEGLLPASALPLGRSETTPFFLQEQVFSSNDSRTPLLGRKRASTMANTQELLQLAASPFPRDLGQVYEDGALLESHVPSACSSRPPTRGISSLGSASGRNLMDELAAAGTFESCPSSELSIEQHEDDGAAPLVEESCRELNVLDGTNFVADILVHPPASHVIDIAVGSPASAIPIQNNHEIRPRSVSPVGVFSMSIFERLRFLFGETCRSPADLARHLLRTAQARMRILQPLRDIQWWLVGILMGPIARRRMLSSMQRSNQGDEEPLMLHTTPDKSTLADRMAYGAMYERPPASPKQSPKATQSPRAKRPVHRSGCPHRRAKHSPLVWLKFSLTLAFAIGAALKDGPASLLRTTICSCQQQSGFITRHRAAEEAKSLI